LKVPYEDLKGVNARFTADLREAFARVVDSGWLVLGREVEAFEREFAAFCGAGTGVGVASGLDALHLALRALELPAGGEVLVPSNTYVATILAIVQAGLKPVLVEPDLGTYQMDPERAAAAVTARTVAIMPVHLYGKASDMTRLCAIAARHGLKIVEDCAQSHGATHRGRMTGTFGDVGCFSFYPTKNLGALGDAGLALAMDAAVEGRLRMLRNYGSAKKYVFDVVGINSRLDEVQAALLRVKLRALDEVTAHKRRLAAVYLRELDAERFVLPRVDAESYDVYHIFNIRHPRRDALREHLAARGIGSEVHYPIPPHKQKAIQHLFPGADFPIADEIHRTTLSLPISLCHDEAAAFEVIRAMAEFDQ
jgi:dTDP-4-amino-4,6-dideoxygalactose transaminase